MSKFLSVGYPISHAGVERVENAVAAFQQLKNGNGLFRAAWIAAALAALLVVANWAIDSVTDGHLLASWLALWALGFAVMSFLSKPLAAAATRLGAYLAQLDEQRKASAQDDKLWELALKDARVMADIKAAMSLNAN